MITALRLWIDKYEVLLMLLICGIMFWGGWYMRGVFTRAAETTIAVGALKAQQASDKAKFKANVAEDTKTAANDVKNDNFNKEVQAHAIKSPIPNCAIPHDSIVYINIAAARK